MRMDKEYTANVTLVDYICSHAEEITDCTKFVEKEIILNITNTQQEVLEKKEHVKPKFYTLVGEK